jgi:serine/threonine-protein kinase
MGLGPGYLISKHVKLVRMLGRGGMGSVWIADHLALKTQVAVKFMSSALATDPNMLTRFEREATSAAQIKSPHVVHILDHGVTGDAMPYIVMELLEGEDLSMRLKRTGPLPPEDVATIVLQTCKALGKAHKLGIVHRDVKPSNIFLLDTDGDIFVKVLDFGIAKPGGKETSDVTSTGAIVGTIVYMSPEQLLNAKHVDYRADLWSVAVVAYRAMTGHLPFSDEDGLGSLCLAFEQGSFVPPSEINPRLTPAIDAWFKRAFKRDPAARFPSMKEMVSELFMAIGVASPMSLVSAGGAGASDARGSFDPPSLRLSATGATSGSEEEAKPTVLDPSQPSSRTAPSSASLNGIEGSPLSNPSRTLSSPKDPATLGTAAALTVPGAGPTPASSGRSKVLFGIVAVLGLLLGGGFLATFLTHRGQVESWMGVSRDESTPRPATEAPDPVGTGPSVTPLATAADPAPRPTASNTPDGTLGSAPAAAASASTSAAAAPSAEPTAAPTAQAGTSGQPAPSSAPSGAPAAGSKPQVRPGTTSRPASPEKDYGF